MTNLTMQDLVDAFPLLRQDLDKYHGICNDFIAQNPDVAYGYYCRHRVWEKKRNWESALADLDREIALEPTAFAYSTRGDILHQAGRYAEAIADFNRAESLDREDWLGGFGPIRRAECHARLGNVDAALADCADIDEEHWMPGVCGILPGDKAAIVAEVKRLAGARPGSASS